MCTYRFAVRRPHATEARLHKSISELVPNGVESDRFRGSLPGPADLLERPPMGDRGADARSVDSELRHRRAESVHSGSSLRAVLHHIFNSAEASGGESALPGLPVSIDFIEFYFCEKRVLYVGHDVAKKV